MSYLIIIKNMPHIELLYSLIPLSLILIIFGLYLYVNIRKKWLEGFFEKQKNDNNPTTNQKYNNELRSLNLVKNNKKTDMIKDEAATMVWEIEKLKRENYELAIEGKKKLSKYQVFASNKLFVGITKNDKKISSISNKFFETVGMVLENIKIARKEITAYKNGLREFKNLIQKNISGLENPKSKSIILEEFGRIEIELKSLDDLVSSNQIERAIVEFTNIKQNFWILIKFANNCEELERQIFTKIPEYFIRIKNLFDIAKKNTKGDFSYIAFNERINSIKKIHKITMDSFSIENSNNVEENVNKILNELGNLNNEINCEIESHVFISRIRVLLGEYKKSVAKLFISIKKDLLVAYQIDKIYFSEFDKEITRLSNYVTEIDSWIDKIKKDEDNYEISFSSKKFKYKSLFYQLKGFYLSYVELNKKLEIFYLEGESNLLKFERLVILLRTMKSYAKSNYIVLSAGEIQNGIEIENLREKITNIILNTPNGTSPNIVNEYKKILSLVSEYVTTVGLKIETSKMFIQVSKILAPKRSVDPKLNEIIIASENYYLDGNYNLALNNIIDTLNRGVN